MPNSDDVAKVEAKLQSYKRLMKRQGDFTIYASNYIQDIEILMAMLPKSAPPKSSTGAPMGSSSGVSVRKKKMKKTD